MKYSFSFYNIFIPIIAILGAAVLLESCTDSKEQKLSRAESLDSLFLSWDNRLAFRGAAMIQFDDTTIYKTAGYLREGSGKETTTKDVFYLGSLAKQFTSMAVLQLVDEGHLNLDDSLYYFFDNLPEFTNGITIRHMLNHTSGLPDYYDMGIFVSGMKNEDILNAMKSIHRLDFEPGEKYAYSNSAYVLLSMIVEKVSGISFREFLSRTIFQPLNMQYTMVYDTTRPLLPSRALGHFPQGSINDYNAFTTGGGGIFSNLEDLTKWMEALDQGQFISPELYEEMYKPVILPDGQVSWYGFGWQLSPDGSEIYQHSGSLAGYRTYMYRDLENEIRIVMLSNYSDDVGRRVLEVLEVLDRER